MAISMKKYVDIKSAINTTRTATEKDLIARIFTTSASLTEDVVECETLADVGEIFATSSDEYKIASKYFSFINKYARSPKKISFAKDLSAPTYASVKNSVVITSDDLEYMNATMMSQYVDRKLGVSINGATAVVLTLSRTTTQYTLNEICSIIADGINTAIGELDTALPIEVSYDDNGVFTYTATDNTVETITLTENLAQITKVSSNNSPIITPRNEGGYDNAFEMIYQTSNNFATFVFLGLDDSTEIATLADYVKQNHPSEFMMIVPVTSSNYATIQGATATIDGVSLELCGADEDTGKFNFVMPMAITATTDYNKENGTVNYMYTQDSNMKVVVDDDTTANTYDSVKVNYYGRTQQAGQKLAFYQNGVLQGNYQDQNIFVNEIWLKDALTTKYINYMLLTANWYANKAGQAIGQSLAMSVIDRAKLNGTITTEKEISEADKVYIYNVTANENAWRQIYQEGFYLATNIEKKTINNQETYVFNYMLLYSKGDSIKKVEGLDILI